MIKNQRTYESKLLKPSDMTETHLINSVKYYGLSHERKAECLRELILTHCDDYTYENGYTTIKDRHEQWLDCTIKFFSCNEHCLADYNMKKIANLSEDAQDKLKKYVINQLHSTADCKSFCNFMNDFYTYFYQLSAEPIVDCQLENYQFVDSSFNNINTTNLCNEVNLHQSNLSQYAYKQCNDNQRKFNLTCLNTSYNNSRLSINDNVLSFNDKVLSLVARLEAAGFKCIAKHESLDQFLYLDLDNKSYSSNDNRSQYANSTCKSLTKDELNILLDSMIQKSDKEHTMPAVMQTERDVTVEELDSLIKKGFPVAFHCYTPAILEIISKYKNDEKFKSNLKCATDEEAIGCGKVFITRSAGTWDFEYENSKLLNDPDSFAILNVVESKTKSAKRPAPRAVSSDVTDKAIQSHRATTSLTREQARSMGVSTQNNTSIINKGQSMKDTALTVLNTNKQTFTVAAKITAGKTINKQVMKKLAPKLPFMLQGYAKHPVASIVLSNVVAFGIKQYLPDNKKANLVADMMMQAAAVETMDSFNFEEMIDELLSDITLPAGALEDE